MKISIYHKDGKAKGPFRCRNIITDDVGYMRIYFHNMDDFKTFVMGSGVIVTDSEISNNKMIHVLTEPRNYCGISIVN